MQNFHALQVAVLSIVVLVNVVLALFVYKNNPTSATNRIYALLGFLISLWLLAISIAVDPAFKESILWWARMSIVIATPMNVAFFLLAYTVPDAQLKLSYGARFILAAITIGVMMINISPYAFTGVVVETSSIMVGAGFVPFISLSFLTTIFAVFFLFRRIRHSSRVSERQQMKFILLGILLVLSLLIFLVLIPVAVFNNYALVPLSPLCVLLFLGMTAYAIIRHHFLDVRLILFRAVSFLIASVLLAVLYALGIYVVVHWFLLGLPEPYPMVLSIVFMAAAIVYFQPLETFIRLKTNSFFFKGDYDKDSLLSQLTKIMTETIDLEELSFRMLETIQHEMKIASATFLIVSKHKIVDIQGSEVSFSRPQYAIMEALFHEKSPREGSSCFVFEDLVESPTKDAFRDSNISVAIPILVDDSEVAILLLGSKLSGEVYNQRDIDFLSVFASQSGIAIQNAKSYTEIKEFSKKLEQRVIDRTKELKESQERELEKAASVAKLKDEFVFVAAHELRTPITAIRGFLELVSEAEGSYPKDVQEDLNNIRSASDHLNQLVNDLLEIARSEADTMKIMAQPVDLAEMVNVILKELESLAKKKRVEIKVNNYENGNKCLADAQKLKEVLVNLIGNAIKYNKDDGTLEISIYPVEDQILVELRDTGLGIPQDQQKQIFQKFFRASSQGTQGILGTGLGLFITRMLVEKMGGTIVFSSVEGEGTTFCILLPKA